jgi:hypothetical protein
MIEQSRKGSVGKEQVNGAWELVVLAVEGDNEGCRLGEIVGDGVGVVVVVVSGWGGRVGVELGVAEGRFDGVIVGVKIGDSEGESVEVVVIDEGVDVGAVVTIGASVTTVV